MSVSFNKKSLLTRRPKRATFDCKTHKNDKFLKLAQNTQKFTFSHFLCHARKMTSLKVWAKTILSKLGYHCRLKFTTDVQDQEVSVSFTANLYLVFCCRKKSDRSVEMLARARA